MKVSELIKKLQEFPQDLEVKIFDWRKNLNEDWGDGSSAGIYDIEVSMDDYTEDEKEYYKERHDKEFVPWVQLSFESDDYSDEGVRYE